MPTLPQRLLTLFVALAFTLNPAVAAILHSAGTYGFNAGVELSVSSCQTESIYQTHSTVDRSSVANFS
jgi:hypothetical protein